jgi:hypothetical protein
MSYIKEILIKDKQAYLTENYLFDEIPKLTDKKLCIHCNEEITVGDFKVYIDGQGNEYICCPNAPDCNGTIIDWFPVDFDFS